MNKESIQKTLGILRKESKKRKFSQSVDLIINLKDYDLKKQGSIDSFLVLHYGNGSKIKVCGLVDKELTEESKKNLDHTVTKEEFSKLDKKAIRNLSREYDYFVAQANLMPQIAKIFGRVFGPKGKMPNPKVGCVVAPGANLKVLKEKLEKTLRIATKNELIIKIKAGKEDMEDEKITDNILTFYNSLITLLPQGKNNIKNVLIKLTMDKPHEIK